MTLLVTSLEELIGEQAGLARLVRQRTGAHPEDARDAVANAIAKLAVDERKAYPFAWVIQAACNEIRDEQRRHGLELAYKSSLASRAFDYADITPDREIAAKEEAELASRIIEELPPRCRQVFLWYVIDGLSAAAIHRQHGIPERTARHYIVEALAYCARRMDVEQTRKRLARPAYRRPAPKARVRWSLELRQWVRLHLVRA